MIVLHQLLFPEITYENKNFNHTNYLTKSRTLEHKKSQNIVIRSITFPTTLHVDNGVSRQPNGGGKMKKQVERSRTRTCQIKSTGFDETLGLGIDPVLDSSAIVDVKFQRITS